MQKLNIYVVKMQIKATAKKDVTS